MEASVALRVPEDATLDAFASQDAAESDEDAETDDDVEVEADDDGPETTDESTEESTVEITDVEPARSTFDWTPTGGECADCGASAERRWRADGQKDGDLVCEDCKEW